MLRLKIRHLAESKGISSALALSQRTGIAYGSCHALWNGEPKFIALETLERLCKGLKVRPGQLFEYEPE